MVREISTTLFAVVLAGNLANPVGGLMLSDSSPEGQLSITEKNTLVGLTRVSVNIFDVNDAAIKCGAYKNDLDFAATEPLRSAGLWADPNEAQAVFAVQVVAVAGCAAHVFTFVGAWADVSIFHQGPAPPVRAAVHFWEGPGTVLSGQQADFGRDVVGLVNSAAREFVEKVRLANAMKLP